DLTVGGGPVGELQEANVFLDGEDLERRRIEAGGEQDLDELLGQALGAGAVADAVEHDHTAVSAERIAGEGALVGGLDGFAEGAAAWVVVLDDRAGGGVELVNQLAGGAEVEQVVEGELLAMQLSDAVEQVRG